MRTQRSLIRVVILLLALAVCLSACAGTSGSSKFYVLSPLPQSTLSAAEGATIGVLPVAMPDYLDRPQIVTRVSENEIRIDQFNRWAEPLKDSFHRTLVQNLSTLLKTEKVMNLAQQGLTVPVALRVRVEVLRFDGILGGDVVLIATWGLFEEAGKRILVSKRASIKEPTGAPGYEAMVAAESRALAVLSREIAEAVKGFSK